MPSQVAMGSTGNRRFRTTLLSPCTGESANPASNAPPVWFLQTYELRRQDMYRVSREGARRVVCDDAIAKFKQGRYDREIIACEDGGPHLAWQQRPSNILRLLRSQTFTQPRLHHRSFDRTPSSYLPASMLRCSDPAANDSMRVADKLL